jgi:hypothetical protein
MLGMLVLIPLFYKPVVKYAVISICATLILFGGVKNILYPAFHIKPFKVYDCIYEIMHISAALHYGIPLSNHSLEKINNILPLEHGWPFSPVNASCMIFDASYNPSYIASHNREIKHLDQRLLIGFPYLFLRYYLRINSYIWMPVEPYNDRLACLSFGVYQNSYGIKMNPILPRCSSLMQKVLFRTTSKRWNWLFWRPGLHHYIVLYSLILLIFRTRNYYFLLVFTPVFLNTAGYLIAGMSQDHRYLFPMTLMTTFFLGLAITKLKEQKHPAADDIHARGNLTC